jgi:hypothetical protein
MKIFRYIVSFLMILMVVWFVMSFVDVIIHNLNPDPVYKAWNLFSIMVGGI